MIKKEQFILFEDTNAQTSNLKLENSMSFSTQISSLIQIEFDNLCITEFERDKT